MVNFVNDFVFACGPKDVAVTARPFVVIYSQPAFCKETQHKNHYAEALRFVLHYRSVWLTCKRLGFPYGRCVSKLWGHSSSKRWRLSLLRVGRKQKKKKKKKTRYQCKSGFRAFDAKIHLSCNICDSANMASQANLQRHIRNACW